MNYTYKKGGQNKKLKNNYKTQKDKYKKGKGKRDIREITDLELQQFERERTQFEGLQLQPKKSKAIGVGAIKDFLKQHNIYVPSGSLAPAVRVIYSHPTHKFEVTEKKSQIMGRLSTLQYEAVKDYVNSNYEKNTSMQTPFTAADREKKKELWGIQTLPGGKTTSAFGNEVVDIRKGDHIFGMREGLQRYNVLGSNSEWNLVPCTQAQNVSWKKIKLIPRNESSEAKYKKLIEQASQIDNPVANLLSKNLVYDQFSNEEKELFDPDTISKYMKLQSWIEYCHTRGAKLFWINAAQINHSVTKVILEKLSELDELLKALPPISQETKMEPSKEELSSISDDDDMGEEES